MIPLSRPRASSSLRTAITRHGRYRQCSLCYIHSTNNQSTTAGMIRKRPLSSQAAVYTSDFSTKQQAMMDSSSSLSSKIIDVSDLAESMRRDVRKYTQKCHQEGNPVRLAGILAVDAMKDRHNAEVYASHIAEQLEEDGILYDHIDCRGEEPQHVEAAIEELNARPDVHGILVYYPIFKTKLHNEGSRDRQYLNAASGVYFKSHDDYLRDVVCPEKDVEGLSQNYNSRWLFRARSRSHFRKQGEIYVPCTALAVARILETYHTVPNDDGDDGNDDDVSASSADPHQPWLGMTATIINRSEIFGRPLASMLALKGATVYSIDEHSILQFMNTGKIRRCTEPHITLDWCLGQSSLVVTGVPNQDFHLPLNSIAAAGNVTVVDVSEFENVKEEDIIKRPGITFVPKIGKVTVAALEQNLISLHQQSTRGLR